MTRDEINSMVAGPELDRLVALAMGDDIETRPEHIWGEPDEFEDGPTVFCKRCRFAARRELGPECTPSIKPYSTSIAHAWKVWDAMQATTEGITIRQGKDRPGCSVSVGLRPWPRGGFCVVGHTVPVAICLALLTLKFSDPEGRQ